MLTVTETWLLFGSHIHQDFLLDHPDVLSGIKEVYTFLSKPEQDELYQILLEINNGEYSTGFKHKFWRKSGADFFVVGKGINALFAEALSAIQQLRQ